MQRGIVYSLPRTLLKVTITYADSRRPEGEPSQEELDRILARTPRARILARSVTVEPILVADPNLRFTLDVEALRSANVAIKDGSIDLSDHGVLTALNAPFEDRTKEIIASVVSTVAKVASSAAGVPPFTVGEALGNRLLRRSIPQPQELQPTFSVVRLLDIDAFKQDADTYSYSDLASARFLYQYVDFIDVVTIRLRLTASQKSRWRLTAQQLRADSSWPRGKGDDPDAADGLFVRVPGPVQVSVYVNEALRTDSAISMAQAGGIAFIPISSRRFATDSTGITISASTGTLSKYTFSTTSSGEGAASAADSMAGFRAAMLDQQIALAKKELELQKALDEIRKLQEAANDDEQ